MLASLLFAVLAFVVLFAVLARYAGSPRGRGAREPTLYGHGPRITAEPFRALVAELFAGMGIETSPIAGDERRLAGRRSDPLHDVRYLFFLEPDPPGDVVGADTILELHQSAQAEGAAVAVLVTPYEIDRTGLPVLGDDVELIDGERLRRLVQRHLRARAAELDRYRGFGKWVTTPRPLQTGPVTTP